MTEWLHFHFSLSCIGGGNGNPLQCYCLENPRDRGAWWAAIYGVAQSQTRLMWLSSSSRKSLIANLKWTIQDKKLFEQSHLKYILIGKILVDWVYQLIKICLITIRILQKAHLSTWHNSGKKQWSWRRVNKYYPKQSTKFKEMNFKRKKKRKEHPRAVVQI